MADFNFENAFLSALNDWQQEVETLSSKEQSPQKKPVISKQKRELELRTAFIKMLNELSFDAGLSDDAYLGLFNTSKQHDAFNFVKDHISLSGFFKFLFDLGYSFCEELDVELFCLLLNAIFLQITSEEATDARTFQSVKSITCLSNSFMTQHKLLKAHYNRYKKVDLGDYDKWYEWNYLPARVNEMKAKAKEILQNCFPDNLDVGSFLDEIYDNSITKIVQADLVMPTHKHFMATGQISGESSMVSLFSLNPNVIERDTFIPINRSPNHKASSVHQKVAKKLALPIFGKTIPKPTTEEKIKTHTIKSLSTFIDPAEEVSGIEPNQGLGPIWEDELSETTSTDSQANFYQPNFAEDDSFSFSAKKKLEGIQKYGIASASVNFDHSKTMNQSDLTGEDTYSGFMTGFNSYQVIRPQRDLSNLSGMSKGQSLPEPTTSSRPRPLRALTKIEEIASTSYSHSAAKQKAFGVFGVNPNGLVDLLEDHRPASTNLTRRREVNRQIPYIAHSREPSSEQKRGILKGGSQHGPRKSGVEDLTLVGRSASQAVDTGSLSSLNTDPHNFDSKEYILPMLPAIDVPKSANTSFKKASYHPASADKQRSFNLYDNVQFFGPEQILTKLKEKSSASAKIPPLKVEKPNLENTGFVWQVKENFDEKQREDFFKKMQQRQERNKRRQENRAKSAANNKKKTRRDKSADAGPRTKVFLNPENRSLYKAVFT